MPRGDQAVTRHLANLARPHYVFRPAQAIRRVATDFQAPAGEREFLLPWGAAITCDPSECVGLGIMRRGVYDLLVCETLLRLSDVGETALDVGANFGQMTSLLAYSVGRSGRVIAFEPHPVVFSRLARNARNWALAPSRQHIDLRQVGLSDVDGAATLSTDVFEINQGSASLEPLSSERGAKNEHRVRVERLDHAIGGEDSVGVMKLDVEGHEIHALAGARALLASGRIRDIVFEERDQPPTAVTRLLQAHGYAVLQIAERLRGPAVGPLGELRVAAGEDPSFLATREPERAIERLRTRGWAIYGIGPAGRVERARRLVADP
jgi:FkbM family methyltransferase